MKAKIIAIANQKGGVGKTTTVINLASALGLLNKKILIIDTDSQANLTTGFGIKKESINLCTYEVITKNIPFEQTLIKNVSKNVDLCPAVMDLASIDIILTKKNLPNYFKEQINLIRNFYDYIFIDCSPSLGIINRNVFASCDSILVPVQVEFYALEGLTQLLSTISIVKKFYNKKLYIEGILLTMFVKTANLSYEISNEVQQYFNKKVYDNVIYRNIKISESQSVGQPIVIWSPKSIAAKNYMDLAKEFLTKNKRKVENYEEKK